VHPVNVPKPLNDRTYVYKIEDVYGVGEKNLPYWFPHLDDERRYSIQMRGILYRPDIVDDITDEVQEILNSSWSNGIIVKGPTNIGKSYTLLNEVVYLESTRDYLVTYIPDCAKWDTALYLVEAIFKSFGSDASEFGYNETNIDRQTIEEIIDEIDFLLVHLGKKWVFVFDQMFRIALRFNPFPAEIGALPFPFNQIESVMKAQRITSIVSVSSNIEESFYDNHAEFHEYRHRANMDRSEVEAIFSNKLDKSTIDKVMKITDGVPGYVDMLLNKYSGNFDDFQGEIDEQVAASLDRFKNDTSSEKWMGISDIIVRIILDMETWTRIDCHNQFLIRCDREAPSFQYNAVIPAVTNAYKSIMFDYLLSFVENKTFNSLSFCRRPMRDDSAEILFPYLVIERMLQKVISFPLITQRKKFTIICTGANIMKKSTFPLPSDFSLDGLYVPTSNLFPAIDVILKQGKTIIGVQANFGEKPKGDVTNSFATQVDSAGWPSSFDEIYLIYLMTTKEATDKMKEMISRKFSPSQFSVIVLDIKCVRGLSDLL
jgi:hypothetical protein